MIEPVPEAITAEAQHRVRRPVMLQGWFDLSALHWRYDPAEVQARLPERFSVDTFDGAAWVGLIPFDMRRVRLPGVPPFGRWSSFPETNVRTYIVDPAGRRGVWFFSLDINRLVPAVVARVTYHLPYCWAVMTLERDGDTITYTSRRRWPSGAATSRVQVRIGASVDDSELTPLDHFLTARWALGSTFARRAVWAQVDHGRWPLHDATVLDWDESLVRAAGLSTPIGEPIVRWSPGVEVRIGRPRALSGTTARRPPRRQGLLP